MFCSIYCFARRPSAYSSGANKHLLVTSPCSHSKCPGVWPKKSPSCPYEDCRFLSILDLFCLPAAPVLPQCSCHDIAYLLKQTVLMVVRYTHVPLFLWSKSCHVRSETVNLCTQQIHRSPINNLGMTLYTNEKGEAKA